jgi:hypothetical protein
MQTYRTRKTPGWLLAQSFFTALIIALVMIQGFTSDGFRVGIWNCLVLVLAPLSLALSFAQSRKNSG